MPLVIIKDKPIADIQDTYKDIINFISFILRLKTTINTPLKLLGRIKIIIKKSFSIVIGEAIKAFNLKIKRGAKGGIKEGIIRGVKGGIKKCIKGGVKRGNSYYK